ncbi:MAG TPA: hypothetical protein VFF40_08215 [Acidimicrobiia bacterium]|nr:hypothetical protein [Acidimicrobiia bacterium]
MRPTIRALVTAVVVVVPPVVIGITRGVGSPGFVLATLAGGIVVGELLELCPPVRAAIPLSYAVVLVLLRAASVQEFVITVAAAELVAAVLRDAPGVVVRVECLARRLVAIGAALGVYSAIASVGSSDNETVMLAALAGAGLVEFAVDEVAGEIGRWHLDLSGHGRSAQLALVTSGMLMAVGYGGLGGRGGMGLWGPALFSVPLLAAWYSFARLAVIRRTYTQTLRALSIVPELGGLVRPGHGARVADVSTEMGRELGLEPHEIEYLQAASLLHHIGHVCLDDPEVLGRPIEASEVARASAEMLRQAEFLAPAADLLSPDPLPFGGAPRSTMSTAGQVLRVASAFDELSEGGDERLARGAVEALYSGPGYVYDPRVLAALERVLERVPRVDGRVAVT